MRRENTRGPCLDDREDPRDAWRYGGHAELHHARYLPRRLDRIMTQTYQHFELNSLDEASTDNSRDVIESYTKDPGEGDLQCGEQRRHLEAVELGAQPRPG